MPHQHGHQWNPHGVPGRPVPPRYVQPGYRAPQHVVPRPAVPQQFAPHQVFPQHPVPGQAVPYAVVPVPYAVVPAPYLVQPVPVVAQVPVPYAPRPFVVDRRPWVQRHPVLTAFGALILLGMVGNEPFLLIPILAGLVAWIAAVNYRRRAEARTREESEIAARADAQHRAYLDGDPSGIYGYTRRNGEPRGR